MKLYEHQIKALSETKDLNKVAYYLDMGLGKTFVGAEKMKCLDTKVNLLICQKSKIDDWIEHFVDNNYEQHFGMIYDCTKWNKKDWTAFSNNPNKKCLLIINYELAWRRKELNSLNGFTLMLDESSLIQNRKAKQSKFIMKLNYKNLILLSGTPTSGKYENLWSQLYMLGYNISEEVFLKQYVNQKIIKIGGVPHKTVDKDNPYKNVDRLKRKMRAYGCVFMKTEDCFDLPEQTFIEVKISNSPLYKKFMKNSYALVDDTELVGDTSLTKRLRARQICGQYCEEKLNGVKDLIESTNDRIVIFYNFTAEMELIENLCKSLNKPVGVVNGERNEKEIFDINSNAILLCQYQAGSRGLNLQKSNKIIYFTLPERSEFFEQSKKRIHRIGQKNKCFYYVMLMKNSIEEDIYKNLKQGKDYTDELFREEHWND